MIIWLATGWPPSGTLLEVCDIHGGMAKQSSPGRSYRMKVILGLQIHPRPDVPEMCI